MCTHTIPNILFMIYSGSLKLYYNVKCTMCTFACSTLYLYMYSML